MLSLPHHFFHSKSAGTVRRPVSVKKAYALFIIVVQSFFLACADENLSVAVTVFHH